MHFADEAHITVTSGNGGNGAVSYRREKYIAKGGPNGGNGGKGGSVYLIADSNLNTLVNFVSRKHYKAPHGQPGSDNHKFGKQGEDVELKVPVGTLVFDGETQEQIADLTRVGQKVLIAKGGIGGKGNANFKSSTRQTPDFAELGEPGEEKEIHLELKLIAEIAIIGYPSVGKSTLISRISNAKPKIADYPFTTLVPNLGVVKVDETDFVVADIPGLIEGAHEGRGLGDAFLKHIERAHFLLHLLDVNEEDPWENYVKLNRELELYSEKLAKKPQLIAFSKVDATIPEIRDELTNQFEEKLGKDTPLLFISSVSGEEIDSLLYKLKEEVLKLRAKTPQLSEENNEEGHKIFRPHEKVSGNTRDYHIEKTEEGFEIYGKRLEQLAIMTDMTKKGGVYRMHDILEKVGVYRQMKKLGGEQGDKIIIGEREFEMRGDMG